MSEKTKNEKCEDKRCPIHGNLVTRGRKFEGIVIGKDLHGTAKIEWSRKKKIQKYERYEIKRSRVKAHVPKCMEIGKGDKVLIEECRPLSKTKNFVITQKIGTDILYKAKEEALIEGKFKESKKEIVNKEKRMEEEEKQSENNDSIEEEGSEE